jgi:hypothetical protein
MSITLAGLSFASFVFLRLDNGKYDEFQNNTNGLPDLRNPNHRENLLKFLNGWGCRNIAKKYHNLASTEIKEWYEKYNAAIPDTTKNLWELTEKELTSINSAFDDLASRIIATKEQNGRNVTFGPIAAAKMLFAIKPRALIAWDNDIRETCVGKKGTYKSFLEKTQSIIRDLKAQCARHNLQLEDLPLTLNRPDVTIPKLIDEYNWITITRGLSPTSEDFHNWDKWSIVA